MRIKVLYKEPQKGCETIEIENSLKALQEAVGGRIETVTIFENIVLICNEEGRLKNMPFNCELLGADFVGPILIAGIEGDEFCSLSNPKVIAKLVKDK